MLKDCAGNGWRGTDSGCDLVPILCGSGWLLTASCDVANFELDVGTPHPAQHHSPPKLETHVLVTVKNRLGMFAGFLVLGFRLGKHQT